MPKMVQIRNVPDDLHRTLKIRAAELGMSLSDYLLSELRAIAQQPTLEQLVERVRKLPPVELDEEPAATIRRFRDAG
jgi:plasmid stability protein